MATSTGEICADQPAKGRLADLHKIVCAHRQRDAQEWASLPRARTAVSARLLRALTLFVELEHHFDHVPVAERAVAVKVKRNKLVAQSLWG